jgi:hypothetical protein
MLENRTAAATNPQLNPRRRDERSACVRADGRTPQGRLDWRN